MDKKVISIEAVMPGEVIQEELDARGWTQDDLADVMGRTRQHVSRLIKGQTAIGPESAVELSQAFGTSAELWMNLQTSFELSTNAVKERGIEAKAALYERVPVRELKKRNWITDESDVKKLESSILTFLGIESWDDKPSVVMAARKSTDYSSHTMAQIAWACRARQLGSCVAAASFRKENIAEGVKELHALVANPEDVRRVPAVLAAMGIRMVVVQHLAGTKIDGAALWLDGSSPVLALSLRFGRIDNFWHNVFHELVHIREDEGMIDIELYDGDSTAVLPDSEVRANRDAAEYLIPSEKLESFIARNKRLLYQDKVVQFANARKVHPGVVVGQLHHRKALDYRQLTKLLVDVRPYIKGAALTDGWGDCPLVS